MPNSFKIIPGRSLTTLVAVTLLCSAAPAAISKSVDDVYYLRARNLIKTGNHEDASKILLQIYRKHPDNTLLLVELGDCYMNDTADIANGTIKSAQCFRRAIQQDPELGCAYGKLAEWANSQGKYDLAIQMTSKALTARKPDQGAYMERAMAFSHLNKPREALADIDRYIALGRRNQVAYLRRAEILEKLHLYDKAAADYRAMQKISFDKKAAMREVNCLEKLNKTNEALECLTALIKHDPEDESVFEIRGRILAKLGRLKEAVDDYTRVIQLIPSSTVYKERADVYEKMGKKDLAGKDRKEAERL